MGARILVVGEALIDIVGGEEIVGGSPANVALGLGRLGRDVELLTAIAPDARGERIAAHIGADGSAAYEFDVSTELDAAHRAGS